MRNVVNSNHSSPSLLSFKPSYRCLGAIFCCGFVCLFLFVVLPEFGLTQSFILSVYSAFMIPHDKLWFLLAVSASVPEVPTPYTAGWRTARVVCFQHVAARRASKD